MKLTELRDLGVDGLQEQMRELEETIFHLRVRRKTGQTTNPMKGRTTRRELARVKTVIRERERNDEGSS